MKTLDIPEVLIILSLLAMAVWAYYNWTHPTTGTHK